MSEDQTTPETAAATPETPAADPTPERADQPAGAARDPLRGSRTSGLWTGLVLISVLLILLIIFIAQNTDPVDIAFLGWEGEAPLAVALLAATVAGLLLAVTAGSLRILQLRRRVKRDQR
ncbi:DUF1049 domain-containing protein [Nocardioides aestuarii]|uniref:Lipopolysaccharide assembly protein LapA domain-containing protein n=1 Tax=Nocardioides aestuarii TaxID=252231 RepID=A0ABW4TJJ8_9ACTN